MKVIDLSAVEQQKLLLRRVEALHEAISDKPGKCPKTEIVALADILNALYCSGRAVPMLEITVDYLDIR